ncbi:MAG: hypothetical protein Q9170_005474 [Blastenia crenularia]
MPSQFASPIPTFLTNIRLLDLEDEEAWPTITADLFNAKDARATQKQRIRCVEWALYRLFELWNSKDTKNKLQPFFPPYDALRSINLRAALFRCLNELKKDGILGKEITIRKTMFDDCRGEKFEELLASFSTIVLQKVVRKRPSTGKSISGRLATCREVSGRDQKLILPSAIAHQGALRALLRRKELLRERYLHLQKILRAKEEELLKRVDKLAQEDQAFPLDAVPDRIVDKVHEHFDANWLGDKSWVSSIVEADKRDTNDTLLDNDFSTVWSHAENGTIDRIEPPGQQSLLQDLSHRVYDQQSRLRHWQNIQQALMASRSRSPNKSKEKPTPYRNQGLQSPLKFGQMDQNGASERLEISAISPDLKAQYSKLIKRARGDTSSADPQDYSTPFKHMKGAEFCDLTKLFPNQLGCQSPDLDGKLPANPEGESGSSTGYFKQSIASATPRRMLFHAPPTCEPPETLICDDEHGQENYSEYVREDDQHSLQDSGFYSPPTIGQEALQDEDEMARQIISSAINAGASPTKPKTSLTARARQSIAFVPPQAFLPDPLVGSTLLPSTTKRTTDQTEPLTHDRSSTLLERSRRSISLALATNSKGPRSSILDRRQSKQYPRNQFETPRKQLGDLKEMTPPEVLFSPKADYASVFKSRPKVATSPHVSPVLAEWGGVREVDEGEL